MSNNNKKKVYSFFYEMLLIIEPLKVFVLLSLRWLLRSCSLIDSSLGQDTMIILMDWESTKQISEHHAANRDSKKNRY